jgi:hypothetical protein
MIGSSRPNRSFRTVQSLLWILWRHSTAGVEIWQMQQPSAEKAGKMSLCANILLHSGGVDPSAGKVSQPLHHPSPPGKILSLAIRLGDIKYSRPS